MPGRRKASWLHDAARRSTTTSKAPTPSRRGLIPNTASRTTWSTGRAPSQRVRTRTGWRISAAPRRDQRVRPERDQRRLTTYIKRLKIWTRLDFRSRWRDVLLRSGGAGLRVLVQPAGGRCHAQTPSHADGEGTWDELHNPRHSRHSRARNAVREYPSRPPPAPPPRGGKAANAAVLSPSRWRAQSMSQFLERSTAARLVPFVWTCCNPTARPSSATIRSSQEIARFRFTR